jgi:hypothetical protein
MVGVASRRIPIDDFVGKRGVADEISQAIDRVDLLLLQIVQDRLERRDVRVDVTEDGNFHESSPAVR